MTNLFCIGSKAGLLMGVFAGADESAAVAALNADAGGFSSPEDWIITEITDVAHERGVTFYKLRGGSVLVEHGPHLECYDSMEEARAAVGAAEE